MNKSDGSFEDLCKKKITEQPPKKKCFFLNPFTIFFKEDSQ
jgi:hypothetical protein